MEKWYSKFRRGDVWFLHISSEDGDGRAASSVEKKSRPYLIVSCEENNMNAPTINVIPITTRNNDRLPMHVFFVYQDGSANGRNQLILCEQVTTMSELVFNSSSSRFMYSLSLELMNRVDEALTRQLGLKPRVADMKIIERLIEECAAKKEAELKQQKEAEVQQRVESIVNDIAKRFGLELSSDVLQNNQEYRPEELQQADKETVAEMRKTAAKRKSLEAVKPVMEAKAKQTKTAKPEEDAASRKKRSKWTPEGKRQFLLDYKTLNLAQMAEKYGIKKSSIAYNACVFRQEVGDVDPGAAV